jgi:hypothetical protein
LIASILALAALQVSAAEIEWITVERNKGIFDIRASLFINAPGPEVYAALLEYDQFAELSASYAESYYIEPASNGAPRIYTRIAGCIWFFCRSIERYSQLELQPSWQIISTAEPDLSSAELSIERWTLSAQDGHTRIDYSHEIDTGSWVPPLIGPWMVKKTISTNILDAIGSIEELAQARMDPGATAGDADDN